MYELPFFLTKTALTVLVVMGITQIRMQTTTLSDLFKISCYNYAVWLKVSYSTGEYVLLMSSFN